MKLAVLRALEARIKDLKLTINAELLCALEPGDTKAATLDDGTKLGKVSMASGRDTPTVVNERLFTKWVKENYPTEIIETVAATFQNQIFAAAKAYGAAVDPATGEVIPGVELRTGQPYISFRGERGYEQIVADRWQDLAGPLLLDGE